MKLVLDITAEDMAAIKACIIRTGETPAEFVYRAGIVGIREAWERLTGTTKKPVPQVIPLRLTGRVRSGTVS